MMEFELPVILYTFDDYHDIDWFGSQAELLIPYLKWQELGFDGSHYCAVFYIEMDQTTKELIDSWYQEYPDESLTYDALPRMRPSLEDSI